MFENNYYYNGVYIDLDGLPLEEYMKSCCSCCGGGSSDESVKPKNKITLTSRFDEKTQQVYYQAKSQLPVSSNLIITVTSTTNKNTVLEIFVGETLSKEEIGDTLDYLKVDLNVFEDEDYNYIVTETKPVEVNYIVYTNTVHSKELGSFNNFIESSMTLNSSKKIEFKIPKTNENLGSMTDDEFKEFVKNNQYCFVICLPKKIYELNKYHVYDFLLNIDMKRKFVLLKDSDVSIINNIEYVYLYEGANENDEISLNTYCADEEDKIFEYKITLLS